MDCVSVAKIIINECMDKNISLTITKLHKLLYIVYGTYLVLKGRKPFEEEPSCYEYGPIFKSLQKEYKTNNIDFETIYEDITINDDDINKVVLKVLELFGKYSAQALSEWTHRKGSAWEEAEKESDRWGNTIKEKYILDEFKEIYGK